MTRFDCGLMEVLDMEDDLDPPPPKIDSFAAKHLKLKLNASPERRIRLAASLPNLYTIEESPPS